MSVSEWEWVLVWGSASEWVLEWGSASEWCWIGLGVGVCGGVGLGSVAAGRMSGSTLYRLPYRVATDRAPLVFG